MTKEELVFLTIRQLNESLRVTPENFRLEDPSLGSTNGSFHGPTVIWQFKVEMEKDSFIADPLNATKTIIVTHNRVGRQLQCYIYNREVNNLHHAVMADTQAQIQFPDFISPMFFRSFREFYKLRKSLIKRKNDKEYLDYIMKLNQIFPNVHDDDLFSK